MVGGLMLNESFFVNQVDLTLNPLDFLDGKATSVNRDGILLINNFLTQSEVNVLINSLKDKFWKPVGIDGFGDFKTSEIGSYRLSYYNRLISECFFYKVALFFNEIIEFNNCQWKAVGMSPLFRFIKYSKNSGKLIPHYDAPFIENESQQTMKSFIIYLTTGKDGSTRFLLDQKNSISNEQENYKDQFIVPNKEDIYFKTIHESGNAVAFNHRTFHDSESNCSEKIIIRTDIVYEKI
jgi:hypothetical protein